MADYTIGSLAFVYGTGNTMSAQYVGRPQGFRTSIAKLPITLNVKCKVTSITFKCATEFKGSLLTWLCNLNQSSSSSTASGTSGNISWGTNSVTITFNKTLDAGTYYCWFYFSGENFGYVGSASIPFAFNTASIVKSAVDFFVKTGSSASKQMLSVFIKTGASAYKTITNSYIKTGSSSYKEIK